MTIPPALPRGQGLLPCHVAAAQSPCQAAYVGLLECVAALPRAPRAPPSSRLPSTAGEDDQAQAPEHRVGVSAGAAGAEAAAVLEVISAGAEEALVAFAAEALGDYAAVKAALQAAAGGVGGGGEGCSWEEDAELAERHGGVVAVLQALEAAPEEALPMLVRAWRRDLYPNLNQDLNQLVRTIPRRRRSTRTRC